MMTKNVQQKSKEAKQPIKKRRLNKFKRRFLL